MNGYNERESYVFDSNGVGKDKYGNEITLKEVPKWAFVKQMIKSQTQMSFDSEDELDRFMKDNPQYEINQRFGQHTKHINLEFYERAYAKTNMGPSGYRLVTHWLTEEETEEYLASLKK